MYSRFPFFSFLSLSFPLSLSPPAALLLRFLNWSEPLLPSLEDFRKIGDLDLDLGLASREEEGLLAGGFFVAAEAFLAFLGGYLKAAFMRSSSFVAAAIVALVLASPPRMPLAAGSEPDAAAGGRASLSLPDLD